MIESASDLGHDRTESRNRLHVGMNDHPHFTQKGSMVWQRWHQMLLRLSHEIRQHGNACILAYKSELHLNVLARKAIGRAPAKASK